MLAVPSSRNLHFTLHFLPAIPQSLRFSNRASHAMARARSSDGSGGSSSSSSSDGGTYREPFSREGSYDSTIHYRRTMSRKNSTMQTLPPALEPFPDFFTGRVAAPIALEVAGESDAECWERMLLLQREYRCYKSARLEAAVEVLENGAGMEEVPVPSRLCLDLLNDSLRAQIDASRM